MESLKSPTLMFWTHLESYILRSEYAEDVIEFGMHAHIFRILNSFKMPGLKCIKRRLEHKHNMDVSLASGKCPPSGLLGKAGVRPSSGQGALPPWSPISLQSKAESASKCFMRTDDNSCEVEYSAWQQRATQGRWSDSASTLFCVCLYIWK